MWNNSGRDLVGPAGTIENGAETKHLNSTRTARPPKGPGSSSRIQMLKSNYQIFQVNHDILMILRRIHQNSINRGSRFVSHLICIPKISNRSEKSSNDRKIARIAPISTIFRPIESQRRWTAPSISEKKLRTSETSEKFSKNSLLSSPLSSPVVFGEMQIGYHL